MLPLDARRSMRAASNTSSGTRRRREPGVQSPAPLPHRPVGLPPRGAYSGRGCALGVFWKHHCLPGHVPTAPKASIAPSRRAIATVPRALVGASITSPTARTSARTESVRAVSGTHCGTCPWGRAPAVGSVCCCGGLGGAALVPRVPPFCPPPESLRSVPLVLYSLNGSLPCSPSRPPACPFPLPLRHSLGSAVNGVLAGRGYEVQVRVGVSVSSLSTEAFAQRRDCVLGAKQSVLPRVSGQWVGRR